MARKARSQLIRSLAERIRRIERSGRPRGKEPVSTGIDGLDRLLPEQRLRRGTLMEWLSVGEGAGTGTLAIMVAVRACRDGGALVVVDAKGEFYPPAALLRGVPTEDLIVVRPGTTQDVLWALNQALRCSGVAAALSWVGRLEERSFRQLRLAAEAGGGIGLLIRPADLQREPSWAEMRVRVAPVSALGEGTNILARSSLYEGMQKEKGGGRRVRLELLRCYGGRGGGAVELEIDDETGDVRLAPKLAAPAVVQRTAGA